MNAATCFGFLVFFTCELPPPTPPVVVCPQVPAWSRDFQAKLADGMEFLQPGSAMRQALREHIQLRTQLRKCREK